MKKVKRYQEGGEAEGVSGTAGRTGMERGAGQRTLDDMTFGEAFKAKRRELGKGKTFKWRGNTYTTGTKEEKAPSSAAKPTTKPAAPEVKDNASAEDMQEFTVTSRRKPASTIGEALSARLGTSAQRKAGSEKGTRSLSDAIRGRLGTQRQREDYKRGMKSGGSVKKYVEGGKIDGIAKRGKTRGRVI